MDKGAIFFAVLLLCLSPLVYAEPVVTGIIDGIKLEGNASITIEGGSHIVYGGLILEGNSSLTLNNTVLTFADIEEAEYTVSGNSRLTAINCSIVLESPHSLQASQNASIKLINVEFYSTYEVNNRTYFSTGIGLSGNSRIRAQNSNIGFIRLAENAECSVNKTNIGNFGTQSSMDAEFNDSTIESTLLYYERSRVQINQTITGKHDQFTQSQLVKAGESAFDFKMNNCTLLNPPRIIIVDGKLEAINTTLDTVYIDGDSAIEAQNTHIYYLRLTGYSWAFIEDSEIDYLSAWDGDFNIQLTNTTHRGISTHRTLGLNLKTNGTKTDYLIMDWCQPNTPANVEFFETEIGNLQLTMYSPQQIQCEKVTLGNLTLEAGWGNEPPITITGNIDFTEDIEIIQNVKEGYTCIRRVYLVEATLDDKPAANTQITIHQNNKTKTITTNQEGKAIITLTFLRQFTLIPNPQPGGPYLINRDNLTKPITITFNQENYTISLISDTPIKLAATSEPLIDRILREYTQHSSAAIILTVIIITVFLINTRRKETENRQIQ
jgi:hypothetical protein